ncbi:MAG: alpha/beta fold hydrolase [Nanoarchaeota archaeon]|nr:alpha/beta fold hydrolase [Nanoarchaeota archaeon]
MRFFIIHGAYGDPEGNWFPWLKQKLEELGHEVYIPKFPTPEDQTLKNWMKIFQPYMDKIDEETVFIGHSLGPAFILNILEKVDVKVKACFFVAGFAEFIGNEQFDSINKSFVDREFEWRRIHRNCEQFYIINSDNDPYVPIIKGNEIANKFGTKAIMINGAGHFNTESGYTEFPQLVEYINLSLRQKKVFASNQQDEKLVGYKAIPSKQSSDKKIVILAHGFGYSKSEAGMFDQIAIGLNNKGYIIYRFDFSGCGESDGDYSETSLTKHKDDLKCITDFVAREEQVDKSQIGLLGMSFGTAATIALKPDIKAIVLLGSIAHPKEIISKLFDTYRPEGISEMKESDGTTTRIKSQFWQDCDSYDLLSNVSRITCPIMFIHGTKDDIVPISESMQLYENANEPKELKTIKDAGHGYRGHREEMLQAVVEWFGRYL